jgi:hypothetical protein
MVEGKRVKVIDNFCRVFGWIYLSRSTLVCLYGCMCRVQQMSRRTCSSPDRSMWARVHATAGRQVAVPHIV